MRLERHLKRTLNRVFVVADSIFVKTPQIVFRITILTQKTRSQKLLLMGKL